MNSFLNIEDVGSVKSVSSWDLSPGFLKVFYGKMILTLVYNNKHQLRYGLEYMARLRYWRPKILFDIASIVLNPICIDAMTTKSIFDRTSGHFVSFS